MLKGALRRTLMRMAKSGSGFKARRRMFFRMVHDDAEMLAKLETMVKDKFDIEADTEFKLLKWLWEHREEIMEFVLQIIALFAK